MVDKIPRKMLNPLHFALEDIGSPNIYIFFLNNDNCSLMSGWIKPSWRTDGIIKQSTVRVDAQDVTCQGNIKRA